MGERVIIDHESLCLAKEEIAKDVAFLAEMQIMDYSLLLGA